MLLVKLKLSERAKNKLLTVVCGVCLAVGAAIIFLPNHGWQWLPVRLYSQ